MMDQSLREYQDVLWTHSIPTLVCGGGKSAQPRAGLEMIARRVTDGRLVMFEENGHCLFLENPTRFNDAVDRFAAPLLN